MVPDCGRIWIRYMGKFFLEERCWVRVWGGCGGGVSEQVSEVERPALKYFSIYLCIFASTNFICHI